jgi:imidazolonepropionase-like amidohydrolase
MGKRTAFGILALLLATAVGLAVVFVLLEPPGLPVPERGEFLLRDLTVVNPGEGRFESTDIHVSNGRIASVRPPGTRGPAAPGSSGTTEVRCEGCFALPGLIDMHAHMPPRVAIGNDRLFALLFLANGVTMIREIGSPDGSAYAVRDAIDAGEYPGPRVVPCGWVLDGDPPARANNWILRTPADARAAVAEAVRSGARCLKLYNMLSREVVLAIAEAAAEAGIPITAHVPHSVSLLDAPFIADVQHLTGVPVPANPARVGRSDYLNSDFAALTDARIEEVIEAAKRQGTIHTPALVNEEVRRTLGDPERFPPDPQIAVLPEFWTTIWHTLWKAPNLGPDEAVYEGFLARDRAAVAAFFQAGVTVYAGTDTLMPYVAPGSALEQEVRNFAELGRTPEQALATATTSPGSFWQDRAYGRIEPGLPADLAIYRADPTVSLDALETLEIVVADGRLYRKSDLDQWVERYRRHFRGWLYTRAMAIVTDLLEHGYAFVD